MDNINTNPTPTGKKQTVTSIIIQLLIAALTALSGIFAGCSMAVA